MKDIIINHLRQEYLDRLFDKIAGEIPTEEESMELPKKSFIRTSYESARKLNEDTQIIETGFIDSFGLVSFRAWIEKEFGIFIPDEEVTPKSFATVNDVIRIIEMVRERNERPA